MRKYSILLVDDDPIITAGTGSDLEEKGYEITTANSGEEAIELLNESSFDLVITDLVMAPINGIGVLKKSKEINPEMMAIILTGFGDMTSVIDALRLDADDYMLKPCEPEEMYFRVSRCLEKLELKRKIEGYGHILPVCPRCKKIKDDSRKRDGAGQWMSMEKYIHDKAKMDIKSTYCPECSGEFNQLGIDIGLDLDAL
ncbi:MAG: response regulator [Deltaproteobacteria bacterium]|jgi:DNA-binding NtrC family response regulator|nr:response regulator [Deltaproteobacteria bacterium]